MILSVISLLYLLDGMVLDYVTPLFCCASQEFVASLKITESLCNLILHHDLIEVKAIHKFLRNHHYNHLSRNTIPRVLLVFVSI